MKYFQEIISSRMELVVFNWEVIKRTKNPLKNIFSNFSKRLIFFEKKIKFFKIFLKISENKKFNIQLINFTCDF